MFVNKVNNIALILIASFPLIGMRLTIWVIILFCVTSLIEGVQNKPIKNIFKNSKSILILSSYYLIAILSFIITHNVTEGMKDLETKAAFLVFPVFVFLIRDKITSSLIKKIILCFSVSNVILALYIWAVIFKKGVVKVLESDNYYNPIVRKIFSEISGYHLPYLGLLFGFSCIIFFSFLLEKTIKKKFKALFFISIIILFISMIFFTARMALFCTFIAFTFYGLSFLRKKIIIKIGILFIIIALSLSFLNPIKRRFYEISNIEFKLPKTHENSKNVNFRLGIYYCGMETLKTNWILGLGLGNVQKELNICYESLDYSSYDDFVMRRYNTHNQYLNAWLTYGIFGPIFLLGYLLLMFKGSTKLHKSLVIIFFLALLTENLFEREAGVMLFAFFNTLFYYLKLNQKKSNPKVVLVK
ncbi:O-antigen ligase family protein [Formosa algae]|uniref:O-antigen ligase n=1 Tax=Formosa algae TaxID=225843 RepID=A0A9X1CAA1_9FLAO|nr:O-antigen ligase family protein [Formosa algae]MBP1838712.1 O-antigen ligase [Formosa algae]MDQ0335212.1 O-antigen ligase [Formosa algae]OEI81646.1 hypothetical protein AST99_02905 [Formosa algae]